MDAEVVKGIIAAILLAFGFLLIRKSGKWPFGKQNMVIGLLLLVLAIFISLQALIEDPSDVFIVFATLVLAGAAILTFIENRALNENNRKREEKDRAERGEREQRERSERLAREQRDRTDKMLEVISDLPPKNGASSCVRLAIKEKGGSKWSGRHSNQSRSSTSCVRLRSC